MKLFQYPYILVRIGCGLCAHRGLNGIGQYNLARLAAAHGSEIDLHDLLRELVKCPYWNRDSYRKPRKYVPQCHAEFIDLHGGPPPDLPAGAVVGNFVVIEGGRKVG